MIIISIGTFSYTNSIFYNVVEGLLHYCEWNLCNTEKSIYNVCKTFEPTFFNSTSRTIRSLRRNKGPTDWQILISLMWLWFEAWDRQATGERWGSSACPGQKKKKKNLFAKFKAFNRINSAGSTPPTVRHDDLPP